MAVAITGCPTTKPTNLAWSRTGQKLTLTWKATQSNATSDTNPRRVTKGSWYISTWRKDNGYHMQYLSGTFSGIGGSFTITLPDGCGKVKDGAVFFENGTFTNGVLRTSTEIPTFTVDFPNVPTLDVIEYDPATHKSTYKLTGVKAIFNKPRKTYHMNVYRQGVINGNAVSRTIPINTDCLGWDTNETLTYSRTYIEASDVVKETDYILYTFEAYAKGIAGNSPTVLKKFYVAFPAKPTITGFTKVSAGGNVSVSSNKTDMRPTETLQMQINYAPSKETIDSTAWSDIGAECTVSQNGQKPSIFIDGSKIENKAGQHVFLRCKAEGQNRSVYSDIYMVDDKYFYWSESGIEDEDEAVIQITSATFGQDSESIDAVIGFKTDASYDACSLSWSKDDRAWLSTKQPETYEMADSYWRDTTSKSTAHANTSSITIAELDADTTYYLRARRYSTTDDTKHTRWSKMVKCNTSQEELTGLVLSASDLVATGKDCSFSWEFPEGLKQTQWVLYDADTNNSIAKGSGSVTLTSCVFSSSGIKNVYVYSMFDDGRDMKSDAVTVSVVDAPKLTLTTAPTSPLTTLPQHFKITADNPSAEIQVKVLSFGIVRAKPDGTEMQYLSDVVYSQTDTGEVDCSIPDGTSLWNNGKYQIQAVATANSVKSDILIADFEVAYTDTVATPTVDNVVITPLENKGATIQVNNLADGITWDLYRATNDSRNVLIASDNANGATVTDNFAPYSTNAKCEYIVLAKNEQGQYSYAPFEYEAKHKVLRFDWNDNYVELPYNIEISDETDKQFEQQVYLDGTQKGAWGASVVRSTSLSTDTVYIKDEEVQKKVRELARYQGSVFVRTPLGQAYTANVEVSDINKTYDKKAMAVSFNCTEIDLTSDFMATLPTETA
jgi:hypothetical protein